MSTCPKLFTYHDGLELVKLQLDKFNLSNDAKSAIFKSKSSNFLVSTLLKDKSFRVDGNLN